MALQARLGRGFADAEMNLVKLLLHRKCGEELETVGIRLAKYSSDKMELERFAEVVWEWFGPGTNSALDIYAHTVWQRMKKIKGQV